MAGSAMTAPRRRGGGGSLFMDLAIIIFTASLLSIGGAYLWKQYLLSAQAGYKNDLAVRESQFDTSMISQLSEESTKIGLASKLIAGHMAYSKIFSIVGSMTADKIRFLSMSISAPSTGDGQVNLSMNGYGADFSAVAFQSKVLGQLDQYGLNNVVKNPIISEPTLNNGGTVSFGFTASVNPSVLYYENEFAGGSAGAGQSASSSSAQGHTQTP